jgi:hypothetical protein
MGTRTRLPDKAGDRYCYQPFPNDGETYIRIATIIPGGHAEDICVSLQHQRFHTTDCPSHEALSYVWDVSELETPRVFVTSAEKGRTSRRWLFVTSNLESALRHLHYPDRPRHLRIDALCIDQSCNEEKAPQVAMMGAIYASASTVLVWLGPAADDSDRALATVRHIGSWVNVDWDTFTFRSLDPSHEEILSDMSKVLDLDEEHHVRDLPPLFS